MKQPSLPCSESESIEFIEIREVSNSKFLAKVDLGAMVRKGYSAFPKASALLEPNHQIL